MVRARNCSLRLGSANCSTPPSALAATKSGCIVGKGRELWIQIEDGHKSGPDLDSDRFPLRTGRHDCNPKTRDNKDLSNHWTSEEIRIGVDGKRSVRTQKCRHDGAQSPRIRLCKGSQLPENNGLARETNG